VADTKQAPCTPRRGQPFEVWMLLKDPKKLAKLMAIQDVSIRELAAAAKWKSPNSVWRLLNDPACRSCPPDRAMRIAAYLRVDVDTLFLQRMSSATEHSARSKRTKSAA
jgi:hypothetical protein